MRTRPHPHPRLCGGCVECCRRRPPPWRPTRSALRQFCAPVLFCAPSHPAPPAEPSYPGSCAGRGDGHTGRAPAAPPAQRRGVARHPRASTLARRTAHTGQAPRCGRAALPSLPTRPRCVSLSPTAALTRLSAAVPRPSELARNPIEGFSAGLVDDCNGVCLPAKGSGRKPLRRRLAPSPDTPPCGPAAHGAVYEWAITIIGPPDTL